MDLTTVARVKTLAGIASAKTTYDGILGQLVTEVSRLAERFMDRETETKSRTEYHDVETDGYDHVIRLQAYPVSSVASVRHDHRGEWAGSETTLEQYDQWVLSRNGQAGLLVVKAALAANPNALEVAYTGGMAADTSSFASTYPDVAGAVDQQVLFLFQNKEHLGLEGVSGAGGSVSHFTPIDLLPNVRKTLSRYRRLTG